MKIKMAGAAQKFNSQRLTVIIMMHFCFFTAAYTCAIYDFTPPLIDASITTCRVLKSLLSI